MRLFILLDYLNHQIRFKKYIDFNQCLNYCFNERNYIMNEKNKTLISGIICIVLGILIAVFGGQKVLDIYFGIVALVSGLCLVATGIYAMSKKQPVPSVSLILGCVFLAVGITLFTEYLTIAALINFLVIVVLGSGVGILCYGVYLLSKKQTAPGLMNLALGLVAVVVSILYISVPDFRSIFWIIVGVLIAVYGLVEFIYGIKELKK